MIDRGDSVDKTFRNLRLRLKNKDLMRNKMLILLRYNLQQKPVIKYEHITIAL